MKRRNRGVVSDGPGRQFRRDDESGAVTVDWVVLTAAIVGLGIAVIYAVGPGVMGLASDISEGVSDSPVSGSTTRIRSTSSPNSSMRTAVSS